MKRRAWLRRKNLTRIVSMPILGSAQPCAMNSVAVELDLYFISVAARMLGMHPQTLRKYERLGLVRPARTIGSMRLYFTGSARSSQTDQAARGRWRDQPRWRPAIAFGCRGRAADPPTDARGRAVSAGCSSSSRARNRPAEPNARLRLNGSWTSRTTTRRSG